MKTLSTTLKFLTSTIFILALCSLVQAQATRTWVSGVGDDVNPCSRTAPCKTFAGAISKTAEGGEIDALDPGGFGTITITKAMTIDGTTGAGFGSILAAGTTGVTVNITSGTNLATAAVTLRNLSIQGVNQSTSPGITGVRWLNANGNRLSIENCTISGFNTHGVEVNRTASGDLYINDTTIKNITNTGVTMTTSAGQIVAAITDSKIHHAVTSGITAVNNVRLGLINTRVTHSGTAVGAASVQTSGTNSIINADDIFVSYGNIGVRASAGSTIRLSDSVVTQNNTGISANGGTMASLQGNSINGNSSDGLPFGSTTNKQ